MKRKNLSILLIIVVFLFLFSGCKKTANTKTVSTKPSNLKPQVSYIIGHNIGDNLKKSDIEVDTGLLMQGLKDGIKGSKSKYSNEETQKIMIDFQNEMTKKSLAKADNNKKAGKEYLEKNKANKDIISLPDGLQYKILKEGNGPVPKAKDTVKTNYIGKLIDGTEFDNSYTRGEPATFPVTGVIKGWQEALQMMKVGSKWQLFVPSDLGYGDQDQGKIPPGSTLIFEIELLGIEPAGK